MKTVTLFIAAILFSIFAFCQTEIKLEDINKHVGDSVKVCAKIYGGIYLEQSKGTPTFLNAGGSYPNNPLTLVIWADTRKQFENKPEEFYKDKNVCVVGKVELYKGKVQVVVYNKEQMMVP
jgi:hypothetical protein